MNWPLLIIASLLTLLFLAAAVGYLGYLKFTRAQNAAINALRLINNLSEGVYRSSIEGKQLSANRALVRLNGYASEREMLAAVSAIDTEWYVDPNRRSEFQHLLNRDGYVEDFVSEIRRHKTKEHIWISENARLVVDPKSGAQLYYEGTVRDISERMRKQQAEVRLNKLADMVPGGLFQLRRDANGSFSTPFLSRPFLTLTGVETGTQFSVDRPLLAGVDDADFPDYLKSLTESFINLKPWNCTFRYRCHPDAPLQWLEIKAHPEQADQGAIEWYGCIADITDHKELVQRIERMAYFDLLTDLPNRRLLMNRLEQAVKISGRRRRHGGLLFLDLDSFKSINDKYGHDVGDTYITKIARCLESSLRESDTIARLGGDEFVVLLHDLDSDVKGARHDASMVAIKIMTNLRRGVELNGVIQSVACSMGITVFKGGAQSSEALLKQADTAMYKAKAAGRNSYSIYQAPEEPVYGDQIGAA